MKSSFNIAASLRRGPFVIDVFRNAALEVESQDDAERSAKDELEASIPGAIDSLAHLDVVRDKTIIIADDVIEERR